MKQVIRKIDWLPGCEHGWGNGYVLIPEGHPLHGKDYDDIPVDIHGGLTFAALIDYDTIDKWDVLTPDDLGCWIVGFDTCHCSDDVTRWPKSKVWEETTKLREQIEAIQ